MIPITCHVLDTALGRPAVGVPVVLDQLTSNGAWRTLGNAHTDKGGRVKGWSLEASLQAGTYRITFDTRTYFEAHQRPVFYPYVEVAFVVERPEEHYHIPLLLSPFGYSTYRGS